LQVETRLFGQTGVQVPVIGQGTWTMGDKAGRVQEEIRALRVGIDLGMTHIDTAEMYGDGRAEEVVAKAIEGIRSKVFLVSKVLPSNASYEGTIRACEQSLRRLKTDRLDMYLLHWWSGKHPIGDTIGALEKLAKDGKTRFIGVSNLDIDKLEKARSAASACALSCNQVCYHLKARGIEYDLAPHCSRGRTAIVGYSPFGSGDFPKQGGKEWKLLEKIGQRHGRTPRQVALNFLVREEGLFTIPKSAHAEHVRENAGASGWKLEPEDLREIDRCFPPPKSKVPLAMI
jgi:diketogulonate reductase-like aldo/keto reductase